ncbi:Card1-like endonuclease domain-containing protein [Sulfuricurvum sp.]|uniref:Card1-like endonuclease domain-containing protein n=1 Tax=Sulfuricurvum sp. TaxID=2025608 RepID=UPI003BB64144
MILISLLGDDLSILIPVINEFKDKITHHFIIHDDAADDIRRAKQFCKGLERFTQNHHLRWKSDVYQLDEDSKSDIVRLYHTIKTQHEGEIVLHSTEGFASLALILSNLILSNGGKVVTYDTKDNELNTFIGTSLTRIKLISKLNINDYLTLLNFKPIDMNQESNLNHRKDNILNLFKDHKRFLGVRDALVKKDKKFNYDEHRDLLEMLEQLEIVDTMHQLIPTEQMTLQGTLFEEYVFWLSHELGFDDIVMGAKIDFEQENVENANHRVINEFDILMTHNNRMYTIECKLVKHLDGTEYVYKYDAIIDIFGTGTKAILLNVSQKEMTPYLNTKSSANFNYATIRRARMKDIQVYHDTHIDPIVFSNLARNFFNLPQ